MIQNLKQLLFGMTMACSLASSAQQTINLSTGWNNGVVTTHNTPDDSWNVTLPNGTVTTPRTTTWGYWEDSDCSRWISTSPLSTNGTPIDVAPGTYTYRVNFTVTTTRIDCARLVINAIGADNRVTGLYINSNNYTPTMPAGVNHFDPLTYNQTLYLNPAHLVIGVNTLTITVINYSASDGSLTSAGFNFCGELRINDSDFNIHPNVTGPTAICQGSPMTFNGSLTAASSPSTGYIWQLFETDAAGNITSGGYSWASSWFFGVPTGTFTFPSNLNLTCGKYYMAVLAAVRESGCANWAADNQVFYYTCKPAANAGSDQTVCQSECVTIGPVLTFKSISYSWSANGTTVGSSANISVCPEANTTYTLTTTNNLTGCTNTDQVTVTVLPNEPRFNISTNTSSNDYYTVTGTPIVMNANTVAGFGQYWSVEELNANGASLFNIQNPAVWYPYPASCTFTGFDDYLLNYSGAVNTLPSSPSAGRFLYNHTYRITRGTWNNNCEWNSYAYMLTTVKSANGGGYQVVAEETKAPAFRPVILRATTDTWEVNPNPSNGIFHISSGTERTESTTIEVFDVFGKKIESNVIETGTTVLSLDLSGHAKGIYILNITTGGVSDTHKIILE
jgi:Secretion system C-terminal sorting domain